MTLQKLILPALLMTLAISWMSTAQAQVRILFKDGIFKGPTGSRSYGGCDSCGCATGCDCDAPPRICQPTGSGRCDDRSCAKCQRISYEICQDRICLPNFLPCIANRIGDSCKSFARHCPRKICVPVFQIRNLRCTPTRAAPCCSNNCSSNCDSYWHESGVEAYEEQSHIYDEENPFRDDDEVPPLPPSARRSKRLRLRS